ncbi:hypothetical protein IEE83_07965 [Dyadobacter sp. UP-52]|uniref:Uncharacterized protein n=1 Tax=Dyadobacter subterraneus TaxID=2773304 RepID=A0ABR9W8L8_9BACT|nr:hypothetical protein [Dyadobacter subterraneus]
MREHRNNPRSNFEEFTPGKSAQTGKTYAWKPKDDIRISELARCINFVSHPICHDLSLIDPDCLRHFEIIDS